MRKLRPYELSSDLEGPSISAMRQCVFQSLSAPTCPLAHVLTSFKLQASGV